MTKNTCICSIWTKDQIGAQCPDCGEIVQGITVDQFITDDDFNNAFQNVFGLPVEVIQSLKEVC